MPDYKKGKIYKIVCNITGKVYIGSTTQSLASRIAGHRVSFKRFKKGKTNNITSFQIIEQGDYDIVLIENIACESKDELHRRERHFIETLECTNKYIPTRTKKDFYDANRDIILEQKKHYGQANKEQIAEQRAEHYQVNKERIAEQRKEYRQTYKERIAGRDKEYYQANKERKAEYNKQYRDANKERIAEQQKQYYQANKVRTLEKVKELES